MNETVLNAPGGHVRATAGRSAEAVLDLIRRRRPSGSSSELTAAEVFAWTATISNDRIDYYFTRMHKTTLENYAADLRAGVAFLASHDILQLPIASSLDGRYDDTTGATSGLFYLVRGLSSGGLSSDHLAVMIESGTLTDVSVGFTPGHFECSLCKGDPFDWLRANCSHIPGLSYRDGKVSDAPGSTQCFAWVLDGHLREVSGVYRGATPGAAITTVVDLAADKAARMIGNGDLSGRLEPALTRALGRPVARLDHRVSTETIVAVQTGLFRTGAPAFLTTREAIMNHPDWIAAGEKEATR